MFEFLFVPTILFVTVVMPIWIVMHYRSKKASHGNVDESQRQQLDDLLASIDQLTDRIDALEQILDADHGSWRSSSNTNGGEADANPKPPSE